MTPAGFIILDYCMFMPATRSTRGYTNNRLFFTKEISRRVNFIMNNAHVMFTLSLSIPFSLYSHGDGS